MERLKGRYNSVIKSLNSLDKSLKHFHNLKSQDDPTEIRDSIIKRFEYSLDTLWKFLKEYLGSQHGIIIDAATT